MKNRVERTMDVGRVRALLGILKLSDEEAYNHSLDVAHIVNNYLNVEEASGYAERTEEEKTSIIVGALLHDIGKAFLPFGLQYSSRKFTPVETEIMNTHPILGAVAIKNCDFDSVVEDIILMHHASPNGSGYPRISGNAYGTDIPVPEYVWIVAYADKLDAMVSRRSFKRQKSLKDAWSTLVCLSKENKLPYEPLTIYRKIIQDLDIFKGDRNGNLPMN